jgi:hypothetical protein
MADFTYGESGFEAGFENISVEIWDGFVTGNSKGKSEIQGSFDLALCAFAQDDDDVRPAAT